MSAFAIGVSVSMDSFSAALGDSAGRRPGFVRALAAATPFVLFELGALVFGWALGQAARPSIAALDHWVAFGLLLVIGGRMLAEALRIRFHAPRRVFAPPRRRLWRRLGTALATSVDSAVVGATLAFTTIAFLPVAVSMAFATLVMATAGATFGRYVGPRFGGWAEALGGVVLIAVGTGILVEHTLL